jgi:N-acetylneuraminic acid mutarotase
MSRFLNNRFVLAGAAVVALLAAGCGNQTYPQPYVHGAQDTEHASAGTTSNTWTSGAPDPSRRHGSAAAAVGSKIYVIGGIYHSTVLSKNNIYDVSTNTWSTGAPMPTARGGVTAAAVNGVVYVIGGFLTGNTPTNLVQAYNPVSNTWATMAPEPVSAFQQDATVFNGEIYVVGGYNGTRLTDVFAYDPSTNVWATAPSLRLARQSAFVGAIGSNLVVAGGFTNANVATAETEKLAVGSMVWRTKHSMPQATTSGCGAPINGLLYVAGGFKSNDGLMKTESYDPTTDAWTVLAPNPMAQVFPASATVNGQLFCFDGQPKNVSNVALNITQIYTP